VSARSFRYFFFIVFVCKEKIDEYIWDIRKLKLIVIGVWITVVIFHQTTQLWKSKLGYSSGRSFVAATVFQGATKNKSCVLLLIETRLLQQNFALNYIRVYFFIVDSSIYSILLKVRNSNRWKQTLCLPIRITHFQ